MFNPTGSVSITIGSVVLDRPDRTGRFIAKDLAGGWAYLIGDADGDPRCRGHGVCDGGLDLTLRCAFLSAANRVPDCTQIAIIVETRDAHRMMVRLASGDPNVAAAIKGRPIYVMTRPDARSCFQVRTAAERAASSALRDREHAESQEFAEALSPKETDLPLVGRINATPTAQKNEPTAVSDWRSRIAATHPRPQHPSRPVIGPSRAQVPVSAPAQTGLFGFITPLMKTARGSVALAGLIPSRPAPASRAMTAWLTDLDTHLSTVRGDLQDFGI